MNSRIIDSNIMYSPSVEALDHIGSLILRMPEKQIGEKGSAINDMMTNSQISEFVKNEIKNVIDAQVSKIY